MAQQIMYPAQPNSPATELTAAITNTATTINVLDASKLPAAPNLATIGADETAETVLYTGKSGNSLTGVTRGFSGTAAKAWAQGTSMARYFTSYDADAMRGNIADINAQLAGTVKKLDIAANVLDFGAKGDGITNDTAAFQAAINTGRKVIVPFTAKGYVLSTLVLGDNVEIEGENQVTLYCGASVLFNVASFHCKISNFKIDMNGAPAESKAILLKTSTKVCWFIRISKIQFVNCYGAIHDEAATTNYVTDMQVVDCNSILTKGVQVYIHHSRGFITFRECAVDHTYNTSPVTWIGFAFEDFVGLELEKVDVLGPVPALVNPTYQPTQIGVYIKGTDTGKASVWLTRVLVDNIMGDGIFIENVMNLVVNNIESYQNLGNGITIKDVVTSQINNLFVIGGKGLNGSAPGAIGVLLNNCKKMSLNNVISSENTGSGISVYNSVDNQFSNVQADNNSAGWIESGTSNRNVITNARMSGNTTSVMSQIGTASAIGHWLANGVYRPHDVGVIAI